MLSIYLFIYLSIYISIYLSIHSRCYDGNEKSGFYGPLNPTKKRVYTFIQERMLPTRYNTIFKSSTSLVKITWRPPNHSKGEENNMCSNFKFKTSIFDDFDRINKIICFSSFKIPFFYWPINYLCRGVRIRIRFSRGWNLDELHPVPQPRLKHVGSS